MMDNERKCSSHQILTDRDNLLLGRACARNGDDDRVCLCYGRGGRAVKHITRVTNSPFLYNYLLVSYSVIELSESLLFFSISFCLCFLAS
jgi:hypothetical protein